MQITPYRGPFGDDTAMNAISLNCRSKNTWAESTGNPWIQRGVPQGGSSDWSSNSFCTNGNYIVAFKMKVEPAQGGLFADNTGSNAVKFRCNDLNAGTNLETIVADLDGDWGSWGSWSSSCPSNTAVCGITTMFDNTGTTINDVKLSCCNY